MAAGIKLQSQLNELSSCCRSWRTPDPSPIRNVPDMTSARFDWMQPDHDATPREHSLTRDWAGLRTPSRSPERNYDVGAPLPANHSPNMVIFVDHIFARQATSANWQQSVLERIGVPTKHEQMWTPSAQAVQAQLPPPGLMDSLPAGSKQPHGCCHAIAGEHFCASTTQSGCCMALEGCSQRSDQKVMVESAAMNPAYPVVSKGSAGHPYSCAAACKYAKKGKKGCKDGASCDRCHLCEWKRSCEQKPRKARSNWEWQ